MPKNTFSHLKSVVALSGGVGGARFCHGLSGALAPEQLTVVVNTADDFEHWGLWICPDLDTVMYTLSGKSHPQQGWGLADETFAAMGMMKQLGGESWFQLGDQDLATHLYRTEKLKKGESLSEVTRRLNQALGTTCTIMPMCDAPRQTRIVTQEGQNLDFQEWFVGQQAKPAVKEISFEGERNPSPQVIKALQGADLIIITPSNPYVSVDPILSLHGVREILEGKVVIGISPIVGGRAIKGPLGAMIPALRGEPASAKAVMEHYGSLLNGYVVETGDENLLDGVPIFPTKTVMGDFLDRTRFATEVLHFGSELR